MKQPHVSVRTNAVWTFTRTYCRSRQQISALGPLTPADFQSALYFAPLFLSYINVNRLKTATASLGRPGSTLQLLATLTVTAARPAAPLSMSRRLRSVFSLSPSESEESEHDEQQEEDEQQSDAEEEVSSDGDDNEDAANEDADNNETSKAGGVSRSRLKNGIRRASAADRHYSASG